MHLTDLEKEKITAAIRAVEDASEGELVTVITPRSDDYWYIPSLCASLIALLVSAVAAYFGLIQSASVLVMSQFMMFVFLAVVFRWPPLMMKVIPRSVKHHRAMLKARALFELEGVHLTRGRNGIMLYVSVAEKYVEVIGDRGISQHVSEAQWQEIVSGFTDHVRRGEVCQGYLTAIAHCGELLKRYCPETGSSAEDVGESGEDGELPNHLIEL